MRRIFSDWAQGEYAWIIAPLAIWMTAWLVNTVILMIRRRRWLHPMRGDGQAGWIWKGTFLAAVAWMVVWLVVKGVAPEAGS